MPEKDNMTSATKTQHEITYRHLGTINSINSVLLYKAPKLEHAMSPNPIEGTVFILGLDLSTTLINNNIGEAVHHYLVFIQNSSTVGSISMRV